MSDDMQGWTLRHENRSLRYALAATQGALEWAATVFDDIGRPKNAASLRTLITSGKSGGEAQQYMLHYLDPRDNQSKRYGLPHAELIMVGDRIVYMGLRLEVMQRVLEPGKITILHCHVVDIL